MGFEHTVLFGEMTRRHSEIPAPAPNVLEEFKLLSHELQQHGKYIVTMFPEYTPHDPTLHNDHLFGLADRLLGRDLYARLNATELLVLAFALYSHDWGMAVSEEELRVLRGEEKNKDFSLLPGEPKNFQSRLENAKLAGTSTDSAIAEYVRDTHGLRSGARLRQRLQYIGSSFSEAVAKASEGHTLDIHEIRNVRRYPTEFSLYGQTINLAAVSVYVRIVDLFDIGEDRTPYALWKFVAPKNSVSSIEWRKHAALSPVSVIDSETARRVIIGGFANEVESYAALADLREWINTQFSSSLSVLRTIGGKYDLTLDSTIKWSIEARNFKPILTKFDLEREPLLGLLTTELYEDQPYVFIRELLQNSIDAIDTREEIQKSQGVQIDGIINITIQQHDGHFRLEWEDNGIGMNESTLQSYFCSVGRSWYKSSSFSDLHLKHHPISQFGIGVLSCFTVSDDLVIETRIDPYFGSESAGLEIQIPKQQAHFRIRELGGVPIGTKITLQIQDPKSKGITLEGIRESIRNFAGYVRHKITISVDGRIEEVESLARPDSIVKGAEDNRSRTLILKGLNASPEDSILKYASVHTVSFGKTGGDFEGYYSALLPNFPFKMTHSPVGSSSDWRISDTEITISDYSTNSAKEIFVKGVLVGRPQGHSRNFALEQALGSSVMTEWPGYKITINLLDASSLKLNLSRSNAQIVDMRWTIAMWQEIAGKLKESTFAGWVDSLESSAVSLGTASAFGGIRMHALEDIVPIEETPMLILRAGVGLIWQSYGTLVSSEEIIEAPHDLNYALASNDSALDGFGMESGLAGWSGKDVVIIAETLIKSRRFPWLDKIIKYGRYLMLKDGFLPTEIQLVKDTPDNTIPLACRIWRKVFKRDQAPDWNNKSGLTRDFPEIAPLQIHPAVLRVVLRSESPQIVKFPDLIADYACFGSLFWNLAHPKIYPLVRALLSLDDLVRNSRTSTDIILEYSYLTSNKFLDYVVPARTSGERLGLTVLGRLIDLMKRAGIAKELVPLNKEDFYPGTIGKYRNPYSYDLRAWKESRLDLGKHFP